ALGGLVGADLVLLGPAGHPERHHEVAPPLLDQFLAGYREVLDAGDDVALDPHTCVLADLIDSGSAHVNPGKRRIGDPDLHPRSTSAAASRPSPAANPDFLRANWTAARVARISCAPTLPMVPIRKILPLRWSWPPAISIPNFLTVPRR